MANPLFGLLGGNAPPQMPGPMAGPMQLMQKFQQFRQNFRGNPKEQVQQLLNSGQMTQAQYNQLRTMAQQFMQFLK